MADDPWHYPRPDHTKAVMTRFDSGLSHAIVMFGPRRTGKTEFLRKDLAPAAQAKGWLVVYASFFDQSAPIAVLVREIDSALKDRSGYVARILRGIGGSGALKFKVDVPGVQSGVEISLGADGTPAETVGLALDHLIGKLAERRERTLLMLDEFQEIGSQPNADALAKSLRTGLDLHRPKICTIMTGSSQEKLRRVLDDRAAPFYRFATDLPLPQLDLGFVDHMAARFQAVTGRALDLDEARAAFESFDRNPQLFRGWLDKRIDLPEINAEDAAARAGAELARDEDFLRTWAAMPPDRRAVARMVADGVPELTGAAGLSHVKALGHDLSAAQIQTRLNTLTANGIIDRLGKTRTMTDPAFAAWVRGRPSEDF